MNYERLITLFLKKCVLGQSLTQIISPQIFISLTTDPSMGVGYSNQKTNVFGKKRPELLQNN